MTTVRDLIASSLRLISIVGAGETMAAEDANDGLSSLNQMIASWSADGQVIYSRSVDTKALSAGVQTLTMGPSGDINTSTPAFITDATITQASIVTPLNIWASNVISTQGFPTLQGLPTDLYVNNGTPLKTLQLYPVPYGGLTLTLYSMKPLSTLALNDVIDLPPGFERALKYNLAVEIAPEYEREANKTVMNIAFDSLAAVKRNAQEYSQAVSAIDPALSQRYMNGGYWGFNIYGGY